MASYPEILSQLLPPALQQNRCLFSLPVSPHKPIIPSSSITSLSLHPVLESLLHILNLDLPSAHFLLRHMQANPAWEAMYLHGILHRIEGDLDNARAWYSDVKDSEAFERVWGGGEFPGSASQAHGGEEFSDSNASKSAAISRKRDTPAFKDSLLNSTAIDRGLSFLDDLENAKCLVRSGQSASETLFQTSLDEFSRLLSFCENKFGIDRVSDASQIWVSMAEKHADIAANMITGGEGWREF